MVFLNGHNIIKRVFTWHKTIIFLFLFWILLFILIIFNSIFVYAQTAAELEIEAQARLTYRDRSEKVFQIN